MFKTVVHHTVKDKDNPDYIEENGPFRPKKDKDLYLGHGYYFWDDHIELAHWWGNVHCGSKYVICEGNLVIDDEGDFLDLVGSRQDLRYYRELRDTYGIQDLAIGSAIEFLKERSKIPGKEGVFPFKVIRAVDDSSGTYEQDRHYFVEGKQGSTNLAPKIIICLITKSSIYLRNFKIIYPSHYCQG